MQGRSQGRAGRGLRAGRRRRLLPRDPGLVRRRLRRRHAGPGRRLGGDRDRTARPGRRAHRLRQDAGGVPVGPRPAGRGTAAGRPRAALPGALRLPAQGAGRRRRAQPARPAGRASRAGRARRLARPAPEITVGVRSGDTPADERRRLATHPAGHPHHHARVAVPDAHLGGPRDACAASRRSSSTRCTRSPAPSAAPTWRSRWSASTRCSADRPSGSGCRRRCARSRRSRASSAARPASVDRGPARRTTSRSSSSVVVPVEDLAALGEPADAADGSAHRRAPRSGRTSRSASSTWSRRTARPSCSPTRGGWPSGSSPGSTRSACGRAPEGLRHRRAGRPRRQVMASPAQSERRPARCSPAPTTARCPRSSAPASRTT